MLWLLLFIRKKQFLRFLQQKLLNRNQKASYEVSLNKVIIKLLQLFHPNMEKKASASQTI